jgi:hypothetical protein
MVFISLGPPETLWKYCQTRNQVTLREVGELRYFLFMLVVPDELVLKILGPQQWNHKILKGQCRGSGYRNMLIANRWAHTGVRDLGLFS